MTHVRLSDRTRADDSKPARVRCHRCSTANAVVPAVRSTVSSAESHHIRGCPVSIDINAVHAVMTGFDSVTMYGDNFAPNTLACAIAPR